MTKLLSGALSDWTGRRKPLAVLGYGLAALTKPVFALAGSPGMVLTARVTDRIGKGIRGAPRDAMVADMVPEAQRGAAYGLRQSLDTVGAFLGPLIAVGLMWAWAGDMRGIFAVAMLPAAIAVLILLLAVREPEPAAPPGPRARPGPRAFAGLGRPFWTVTAIAALMSLARISEAFLILRAQSAGLALALAPLVLVGMNAVYALSAWPAGVLSDRLGRRGLLAAGFALLVAADLVLAGAGGKPGLGAVAAGIALWGLHMGLTQGLLAAEVAAWAPPGLRATGFGAFNLVTGLVLLAGNFAAGLIWSAAGPRAAFLAAAAAAALGTLALLAWRPPSRAVAPAAAGR